MKKIIKLEEIPSYNMIEKGALSDNILPSSSKEVQEKEDDLTLKGIPSRHNQPLTTSDIQEKENMHYQSQSIREISKEAIQSKHNLSSATTKTGTGKTLNNDWGKVSNFRTNSPWNKVSANDKFCFGWIPSFEISLVLWDWLRIFSFSRMSLVVGS